MSFFDGSVVPLRRKQTNTVMVISLLLLAEFQGDMRPSFMQEL